MNSVKSGKSGRRWAFLISAIGMVILLIWLIKSAPKYPVAALRVVDAAGKPVAGAVIQAEGLRTKPGPYSGGWYAWNAKQRGVPNNPVITDKNGYAQVPYPKYVFERIETGKLCLSVEHPDYVSDRPERVVATALPAGAPWKIWVKDTWNRIRHKALLAKVDPVVLKKGMVLKLMARSGVTKEMPLFAQVSRGSGRETNFWMRSEPGVLLTHRLEEGTQAVRVVQVAGIQGFRVAGLRADVLAELERSDLIKDVLQTLQNAMDYRLVKCDGAEVPKHAMRLARCFGLPARVLEKARQVYSQEDAKREEGLAQ